MSNEIPLQFNTRIFVAGHRGMVGSAIMRCLDSSGFYNLVTRSHTELDLTDANAVTQFFSNEKFDYVILAAAKVGGIHANDSYPAEFIYINLMIACNVINAAYQSGVKHLLFLGSTCIYPKYAEQPIKEAALLTNVLEPTNEPYAIAKIAGIKLCESYNRQYGMNYRSVMPTNLYGLNDNFDLKTSHVIPALIRKFHEAKLNGVKTVEIWGSGTPTREFLYADDMAEACVFIMQLTNEKLATQIQPRLSHLNIGTGIAVTIKELSEHVKKVVGFHGDIVFNTDMPDGTPKKQLSVERLTKLGWTAKTGLNEGLERTYQWFCRHQQGN